MRGHSTQQEPQVPTRDGGAGAGLAHHLVAPTPASARDSERPTQSPMVMSEWGQVITTQDPSELYAPTQPRTHTLQQPSQEDAGHAQGSLCDADALGTQAAHESEHSEAGTDPNAASQGEEVLPDQLIGSASETDDAGPMDDDDDVGDVLGHDYSANGEEAGQVDDEGTEYGSGYEVQHYADKLDDPLWEVGDEQCNFTLRQALFALVSTKRSGKVKDAPFAEFVWLTTKMLPQPNNMPRTWYLIKQLLRCPSISNYERHACINCCMVWPYTAQRDLWFCSVAGSGKALLCGVPKTRVY